MYKDIIKKYEKYQNYIYSRKILDDIELKIQNQKVVDEYIDKNNI